MKNDALPTPEVEYRVDPLNLSLFDHLYEPKIQREIVHKREVFLHVLARISSAFERRRDGTIRETCKDTPLGTAYAKAMSPSLARLLFQVWCQLPALDCNPCRKLVLGDGRCTECRIKPDPHGRDAVQKRTALANKLKAFDKQYADGLFVWWQSDRLKKAEGRKVSATDLYRDYQEWCFRRKETRPEKRVSRGTILTQKRFGQCLRAAGYRYVRHGSGIFYVGLALRRAKHDGAVALTGS